MRALEATDTGGFVSSLAPSAPTPAADAHSSPNPIKTKSTLAAIAGWFALGAATAIPAQTPTTTAVLATGTIEGRVLNADSGEFVENARVTVAGTALETLTDVTGHYRLTNVPAGSAQVRVLRTGVAVRTLAVTVAASVDLVFMGLGEECALAAGVGADGAREMTKPPVSVASSAR